jgi:hypothetical protein
VITHPTHGTNAVVDVGEKDSQGEAVQTEYLIDAELENEEEGNHDHGEHPVGQFTSGGGHLVDDEACSNIREECTDHDEHHTGLGIQDVYWGSYHPERGEDEEQSGGHEGSHTLPPRVVSEGLLLISIVDVV